MKAKASGWAAVTDWDHAYENTGSIPDGASHPPRWHALAQRAPQPDADGLFRPKGTPRGLMVFIHGGYWMATGPDWYAHLAQGAVARGWAVLKPHYRLAPGGALADMPRQIAAQITRAAGLVAGPLALTGHSAGGHLAARLCCTDTVLPPQITARIARLAPISGLFDLRPLRRTLMSGPLGLTPAVAEAESPALKEPLPNLDVHAWVGADERPEFIRQSHLLGVIWPGLGVPVRVTEEAGRHHFDVIDGLAEAGHPLTEAVIGGI